MLGSPFTDDNLSTRKIVPGYAFRTRGAPKNSPWIQRGIVTPESLELLLNMVHAQHGRTRRKISKSAFEEKSEICALACAFAALGFYLVCLLSVCFPRFIF